MKIIFDLIGGLALFIFGIQLMGDGLHKIAGDKIKSVIKLLTKNPLMGTAVGATITAIIQSSSAVTVLAVGFVNAGLMTFEQTLGIIFGANIGTTMTAQIIAFKLTEYAIPILAIGFFMSLICKKTFWKNLGLFLLGFGILFFGLNMMTSTIRPFADNPIFRDLFIRYSNNTFLAIVTGTIVTGIIQSSSVTIGLVLALANVNLVTLKGAIPLIFGCNIGTCITVLIASVGTTTSAKRTAVAHILFNVITTILFIPFINQFHNLILFTSNDLVRQCANAHSLFNILGVLIFLPFVNSYSRFISKLIKKKNMDNLELQLLERHLLNTPNIALEAAIKESVRTLNIAEEMITKVTNAFLKRDFKELEYIPKLEETIDNRREAITEYLVELMERKLDHGESQKIPALIHAINDIERIGDHAESLKNLIKQKMEKNLHFSDDGACKIEQMYQEIINMIKLTEKALLLEDTKLAHEILKQESVINGMRVALRSWYINEADHQDVLAGIIFLDVVNNLEKIGDHLTNIAEAIIWHLII